MVFIITISGAGVLWIPSLDSLPRRQLHGPVPLPPPSAGKLAGAAAIAFSLHKKLNIFIQTYQQNMSTMCDEWIIVLVFPLHIILSYKSMVVAIEEVYMVSLHTVCVCVWWLSVGKFILKVQ